MDIIISYHIESNRKHTYAKPPKIYDDTMQQVAENLILQQFQQLRQELQGYNNKLVELEAERRDHELVISTIEPLEAKRKCYRLVGGVLVERTVGEVLPALKSNLINVRWLCKHRALESAQDSRRYR